MATGGAGQDDFHLHVLAVAADGSHEAQVFRMHRDKRLEALRRAYASLLGDEPEALSFRMSCALHGQLDRAASYVKRQ